MRILIVAGVLVLVIGIFLIGSQSLSSADRMGTPATESESSPASSHSKDVAESTAMQEDEEIRTIHIVLDNFRFEGPEGSSGSEGKPLPSETPDAIANPKVILRLVNRETVRLVFENVSPIVEHEVISPLFAAPDEERFPVPPGESFEMIITPAFKTADDGGTLTFDLSCHVRHGQSTDHYRLGMHALIEVVPQM